MKNSVKKFIKVELLIINVLLGSGLIHFKTHDHHLNERRYETRIRTELDSFGENPID